jgi:hypothetical protein
MIADMPHRLSLATSLRRAGIATLLIAACLGIAAPVSAQSSSDQDVLIVRVISSVTHQPLVNAEVIIASTQQSSFTNELGQARLLRSSDAALNLRVRQIGFLFADRNVPRTSHPEQNADTVVVALEAVSYKLPKVATTASNSCGTTSDSISATLSALVLSQLRLGAERYDTFRQAYPFTALIERKTVSRDESGAMKALPIEMGNVESQKLDHTYAPGKVLNESFDGKFMVPILSVSSLADPAFWKHHCFVARDVESLGNDRVIRLDFAPTRATASPDWAGSAYVDSTTSMLHRIDFNLTGLRDRDIIQGLVGYTLFHAPAASISMPDSSMATWWFSAPIRNKELQPADGLQSITVRKIVYRKSTPADAKPLNREQPEEP